MLGKLKDLGNTLLGNIGLSTDKCVRDPLAFPTHQSDWLTSLRTAPHPPPSSLPPPASNLNRTGRAATA